MILYFIIGALVSLMVDIVSLFISPPEERFNNLERIIMVLIWPFIALAFLYNFINGFLNR